MLCRSRDLIGNCIGAERGDYTWNGKRFCDLHVDSIRSLSVSLNAIKRTQLLTEHNSKFQFTIIDRKCKERIKKLETFCKLNRTKSVTDRD